MNNTTIRKLELCLMLATTGIAFNALILQSEFGFSLFYNSQELHITEKIDTFETSKNFQKKNLPNVSKEDTLHIQNKKNRETVSVEYEVKNRSLPNPDNSASLPKHDTVSVPQNRNMNFQEKNLLHLESSLYFSGYASDTTNEIIDNAPAPFNFIGKFVTSTSKVNAELMLPEPPCKPYDRVIVGVLEKENSPTEVEAIPQQETDIKEIEHPATDSSQKNMDTLVLLPKHFRLAPRINLQEIQLGNTATVTKDNVVNSDPNDSFQPSYDVDDVRKIASVAKPTLVVEDISSQLSSTPFLETHILTQKKEMRPFPSIETEEIMVQSTPIENNVPEEETPLQTSTTPVVEPQPTILQHVDESIIVPHYVPAEGNFPLSSGEPMELPIQAPVFGHFGIQQPVILPNIPSEKDKNTEDILVITHISPLAETSTTSESTKTHGKLIPFPKIED